MATPIDVNRRQFLKASAGGGAAFILGFYLSEPGCARHSGPREDAVFKPNAWLRITPDNQITILVEKPEMGQGARTSLPMLVAEELEADWSTIRIEQAPTLTDIYKELSTGGSGGVLKSWIPLRQVGAQAREMLLVAAAQQWRVEKKDCRAQNSSVTHLPSGRRLTYGQLVETASHLPPLKPDSVRLKEPKDFRFIGKPVPRTDIPSKTDGSAKFGIDVRVPGMLFAVIARCPHFGGKLSAFDASAAKAVPGVHAVFPIPPLPRLMNTAGGVAVVADSTWAAIQGRNALKVSWDKGPDGNESSESLSKLAQELSLASPSFVAVNRGDALKVLQNASRKVEAVYELPFQPHATMEPMNTTVDVRDDRIEMWSPTQWADRTQETIVNLSGLPKEKVIVHMTLSGGSFGRRGQWDYQAEAWQVGKEIKKPVQLVWTREDDMQHDFYRQYSYHRMAGALDDQGKLLAWWHRVVSTSIREVFDPPASLKDPRHFAAQELGGGDVLPYSCPSFRQDYHPLHSAVPRAWWRSVEYSFTLFAMESFIDELAHAARRDPFEYRMELLSQDRELDSVMWPGGPPLKTRKLREVLKLAAEKGDWGKPLPAGHGRGIACAFAFRSYVAHVAEVSVGKDGSVRVNRIVSAVDCGTAVNPDGVRAMTEGAINFALTPVLTGEITIKNAAVQQSNFDDYQVLRMDQAPDIEVHIVPSNEDPGGMGEPGVPPLAPAVANAVFAATGKRLRRLPFAKIG